MKLTLTTIALFFAQTALAADLNVPKFFPDFWNDSEIQSGNNCYNYATNRVTNNFAQPGESGGVSYELNCESVLEAVTHDEGLTPADPFTFNTKSDETLVALVVSPDWDFHWYRRGDNGLWTHKNGSLPAKNVDESGNEIEDLEAADRGSYTELCGYYRVKNYIYDEHEQDGGQVRIGNMSQKPQEPEEGSLTVLKYSGRRDPKFNLATILHKYPEFAKQLTGVAANLKLALPATTAHTEAMNKLGSRGFLIHDTKGLIFPKGTRVQIWNDKVLVYQPFTSQFLTLKNALALPSSF